MSRVRLEIRETSHVRDKRVKTKNNTTSAASDNYSTFQPLPCCGHFVHGLRRQRFVL